MSKVMAMMAGLLEMAGAKVEEEELVEACNQVMAAIDADGDGEVFSCSFCSFLFNIFVSFLTYILPSCIWKKGNSITVNQRIG